MNNLVINKLTLLSPEGKKAKIINFEKGINVITSDKHSGGNYVGKSSVLRSIFHTLGADGKFPHQWESEGDYIYIVEFTITNIQYKMLRMKNFFILYDDNNNEIFKTSNRDDLASELSKIFLQEIYLQSHDGSFRLSHPVYNYVINYIEQTNIELCKFDNFLSLSAFRSPYEDIIYSHLGVNSSKLNELVLDIDKIKETLDSNKEQSKILRQMLTEIKKSEKTTIIEDNTEAMKNSIKIYEDEYSKLLTTCNKQKQKLYEAIEAKNVLNLTLKEIRDFINSKNKGNKLIVKEHLCPVCNSHLEDNTHAYFENANEIENFNFQLISVEKELVEIEREIKLYTEKYENNIKELKKLETTIFENQNSVEDKLNSIGIRKIRSNITNQIIDIDSKSESLESTKKQLNKELSVLKKKRAEVDKYYVDTLNEMISKYRLGGLDNVNIKKAIDKFRVDGTRVNLGSVLWLTSLLKTKYKFNSEATVYPLIFDNPNNADFDDDNNARIFKAVFDNLPENGQIITSCVGFDPADYPEYTFKKVVVLNNPQNQLLSTYDYEEALITYNNLVK